MNPDSGIPVTAPANMEVAGLVYAPDDRLLRPAVLVTEFDEAMRHEISMMFMLMYSSHGIGFAANQIGSNKAMFVLDLKHKGVNNPMVVINPVMVISPKAEYEAGYEGCLSLPGQPQRVIHRATRLALSFQREDGKHDMIYAIGLLARVIQHEMSHLRGELI